MIYSRLVEGRFPRYQDVFPANVEVKIPLEAGPLRLAVEQASIVTSEESRGVDFQFGAGVLKLASQAADVGSSHVELPIAYEGKTVEITFDPRYLADALKTLDDDRRGHRRADRLQERRRLQDRRPVHLRGDAPDPRPLTAGLDRSGAADRRSVRPADRPMRADAQGVPPLRREGRADIMKRRSRCERGTRARPAGRRDRDRAWRARTVADRSRCPRSWASCSPRGVTGGCGR